jgi:chromatin remodeling complex protein RSC6
MSTTSLAINISQDEIEKSSLTDQFENITSNLILFKSQVNTIFQQIKILEKNVKKEIKTLKKETEKSKSKNKGNKKPSGFAKPTKVTNELCIFMDKTEGSEIARTDVTRALIDYININNLQFSENKQIIIPDIKLKKLLGISDGEQVTYFNIQKYMNKHFIQSKPLLSTLFIDTNTNNLELNL